MVQQKKVELSRFGSELIALKIATEMVEAIRYKLRTFGIPVDEPAEIFCNYQLVVNNLSIQILP